MAKAFRLTSDPVFTSDELTIWRPEFVRLFISHRDNIKVQCRALADALNEYGISAFVAHDSIEPLSVWRKEILKGLQTMELLLAVVTDDFADSIWTNQEIGYALGRGVPIIPLKVDRRDPPGFISEFQAAKGNLSDYTSVAETVAGLIREKLGKQEQIQRMLIAAFAGSSNFNDTRDTFDRMDAAINVLTSEEFSKITDAFRANDQLHGSAYLNNERQRLAKFLNRCMSAKVRISGRDIMIDKPPLDDIPF